MTNQSKDVSDKDRQAIIRAATDYIASWLDGDEERMRRSLHPQLAKRSVGAGALSDLPLDTIGTTEMVEATGWLPHTTRAALTGLRHKAFDITKSKEKGNKTVYRLSRAGA